MVYVIPVKRSSYTRVKAFSKYSDQDKTDFFVLQKRKSESGGRPNFRIITANVNPYYEIAYGNDLIQMRLTEWKYVSEDIMRIMPAALQDKSPKVAKTRLAWILAHFTCRAIEVDKAEADDSTAVRDLDKIEAQRREEGKFPSPSPGESVHGHQQHHLDPRNGGNHHLSPGAHAGPGGMGQNTLNTPNAMMLTAPDGTPLTSRQAKETKAARSRFKRALGNLVPTSIWPLRGVIAFVLAMTLTNVPLLLMREASSSTFITVLTILNIMLFTFIIRGTPAVWGLTILQPEDHLNRMLMYRPPCACVIPGTHATGVPSLTLQQQQPSRGGAAGAAGDVCSDVSAYEEDDDTDEDIVDSDYEKDNATDDDRATSAPVVIGADASLAGASADGSVAEVNVRGIVPGTTLKEATSPNDTNAYADPQGESWQLRRGPNYTKNKFKGWSRHSMFHLVGMDVFQTNHKVHHVAQHLDLASLQTRKPAGYLSVGGEIDSQYQTAMQELAKEPAETHDEGKTSDTPYVQPTHADGFHLGTMEKKLTYVINFQMPTYGPAMMAKNQDGPGISMCWYLIATDETQQDLLRATPRSPAVRILKQLMEVDPNTPEGQKQLMRMKALPRFVNDYDFDLGWSLQKMIKTYNGKPFLSKPQHTVHRGPGYFEFDLDIHNFCYAARKVLENFVDKFDRVILDWGFTVEAYTDDEMPECVIGAFRLFKVNPYNKPSWDATLAALKKLRATGGAGMPTPKTIGMAAGSSSTSSTSTSSTTSSSSSSSTSTSNALTNSSSGSGSNTLATPSVALAPSTSDNHTRSSSSAAAAAAIANGPPSTGRGGGGVDGSGAGGLATPLPGGGGGAGVGNGGGLVNNATFSPSGNAAGLGGSLHHHTASSPSLRASGVGNLNVNSSGSSANNGGVNLAPLSPTAAVYQSGQQQQQHQQQQQGQSSGRHGGFSTPTASYI